jgi:hypothetical protein
MFTYFHECLVRVTLRLCSLLSKVSQIYNHLRLHSSSDYSHVTEKFLKPYQFFIIRIDLEFNDLVVS